MKTLTPASKRALDEIRETGGLIRTREAIDRGIHPRTLKNLVEEGALEQVSRGVYRLAGEEPVSNPDLFTVATRVPKGVICLISALAFHDLTTQIPHKVYVSLERDAKKPRLDYPPLSIHYFTDKAFREGIEKHMIDGVEVQVYSREKTLADCFKFRNQIGMDVVLEALRLYRAQRKIKMNDIFHYAKICHVENVMKPYLESMAA